MNLSIQSLVQASERMNFALEMGVNPSIQAGRKQKSALHMLFCKVDLSLHCTLIMKILQHFLHHGFDLKIRNISKMTLLDIAQKKRAPKPLQFCLHGHGYQINKALSPFRYKLQVKNEPTVVTTGILKTASEIL